MSILIKGMKMPTTCTRCTLDAFGYCVAARRYSESSTTHERASFCPLVELPEKHGRLIDADEFMADICNSINEMSKIGIMVDGDYLWCKLNDALENAPTIVEAEGRDI